MNSLKLLTLTFILVIAAIFAAPRLHTAQAAPPLNDDFYSAAVVSSLPFSDTLDTTEATVEVIDGADPWPCGAYPYTSVWYSFTPSVDTPVEISTSGSDYNTVVGVFTGDYSELTQVDCSMGMYRLRLVLNAGITYSILIVDGQDPYLPPGDPGGILNLNIIQLSGPDNDNFTDAKIITATPYQDNVDNSFATVESGEPASNCSYYGVPYSTVWYSFTPTANGILTGYASASFSDFISIYTGSSVSDLTLVTCNYYSNSISAMVSAGTTYHIQIGSLYELSQGTVTLILDLIPPPVNDDFDNAKIISGLPYSDSMDTSYATYANDDPTGCYNSGSVWYAFTPQADMVLEANTIGSYYDTTLAVYTGTRGALTLVPDCCNDDHYGLQSYVSFQAIANTTYYFLVGRCCGQGGDGGGYLVFNLLAHLPPENDNFENAMNITEIPFFYNGENQYATTQVQEPTPSCSPSGEPYRTVWFKFIPAQDDSVMLMGWSGFFYQFTAVYQGNSLNQLQEVGCRAYAYNPMAFYVQAGKTYYFQLGGIYAEEYGSYQFSLVRTPSPQANFYYDPADPNIYDQIQFCDVSYDPAQIGFSNYTWIFGDGSQASGNCAYHTFAKDGDYTLRHTVTTLDGRSATATDTISVRTHDVAITKFLTPMAVSPGQTRPIIVGIRNKNYPEQVIVTLMKGTPYGFQTVNVIRLTIPAYTGNRTTDVKFDYTFTEQDAIPGKVSFKATVDIYPGRDAIRTDNESIGKPTKINTPNKPSPYSATIVDPPKVDSTAATFGFLGLGLALGFFLVAGYPLKSRGRNNLKN